MPLSNLISTTATIDSYRAPRPTFGKPVILDELDEFDEVSREVATRQELLSLGFTSSSPVLLMFDVMTRQRPARPRTVIIGRREAEVAQVVAITFTGTADGTYTVPINGVAATFVANSNTADEIRDGLAAAVDALTEPVQTGSPGASTFNILSSTAGLPFVVGDLVSPGDVLEAEETTPNHGTAEDAEAVAANNATGYAWFLTSRLNHNITEMSRWTEGVTGLFFGQTDEAGILDGSVSNDMASVLLGLQRTRTVLCYKSNDAHYFDAAWGGKQLPKAPGSTNWAWKDLAEVPADTILHAQSQALQDKRVNWLESIGGLPRAYLGMTSAPGIWIDLVRGRDKVVSDVTLAKIDLLGGKEKLDYDELPILAARIESAINKNTGFVVTSETTVTLPDTVPIEDVTNREANGITWKARIRVPINKVTSAGTLTVGEADLEITGEA